MKTDDESHFDMLHALKCMYMFRTYRQISSSFRLLMITLWSLTMADGLIMSITNMLMHCSHLYTHTTAFILTITVTKYSVRLMANHGNCSPDHSLSLSLSYSQSHTHALIFAGSLFSSHSTQFQSIGAIIVSRSKKKMKMCLCNRKRVSFCNFFYLHSSIVITSMRVSEMSTHTRVDERGGRFTHANTYAHKHTRSIYMESHKYIAYT